VRIINHSEIGLMFTNLAIFGAPHCGIVTFLNGKTEQNDGWSGSTGESGRNQTLSPSVSPWSGGSSSVSGSQFLVFIPPPKESTVSYMAMSSGFVLVWLGLQISRLDWTLHFFLVAINYNKLHCSALFHKATPSIHAGYVWYCKHLQVCFWN